MAMSVWMGGLNGGFNFGPGLNNGTWRAYRNLNEMTWPGPSGLIVFSDQREDENTWPNLFFDMSGYPNNPEAAQFNGDLVPFYHGGATSYSFADGHSAMKHWTDSRTKVPVLKNNLQLIGILHSPNNPDIRWLQEHVTQPK
jgi:prepilin-type processing-associated H-X9-DG protein